MQSWQILPQGPVKATAQVTESIISGHGFVPQQFQELLISLQKLSLDTGQSYWQDVFVLRENSQIFPKHPLLLSIIAVPFAFSFGEPGYLLLAWTMTTLIVLSFCSLTAQITGRRESLVPIFVVLAGTQTFLGCFSPGADLLNLTLFLVSAACMATRPLLSGFLAILMLHIRVTNIALLVFAMPLLTLTHLSRSSRKKAVRLWAVGALAAGAILGGYHYFLFGNPFIAPQQRMPIITPQGMRINPDPVTFSFPLLFEQTPTLLVNLVAFNLSLLLFPLTLRWMLRRFDALATWICSAMLISQCALYFSYLGGSIAGFGNRYLMPVVTLLAIYLAAAVDQGIPKLLMRLRENSKI